MTDRRRSSPADRSGQPAFACASRRKRVGRLPLALLSLLSPLIIVPVLATGVPAVQARNARQRSSAVEAPARSGAATRAERRAAALAERQAAKTHPPRLTHTSRAGGSGRRGELHGHGPEREDAIVTSTCKVINWTYRRFPNLPANTVIEKITVGHYAAIFQTLTFNGEGHEVLTPINEPPGRARLDTHAKWRTNGARGHFDILSKKECPPAPSFTIEKLQRFASGGGDFTTAPLTATLHQTVEYEIVVRNTGNVPLVLSNFSDPRCDRGTLSGGQGETPLAPGPVPSMGDSTTYTCKHEVTSASAYDNYASVTATPPTGDGLPLSNTSNTVVVSAPVCRGSGGPPQHGRRPFQDGNDWCCDPPSRTHSSMLSQPLSVPVTLL